MNRRAFLGAIFGAAFASALPAPKPNLYLSLRAFRERYLAAASSRIAAQIDAKLVTDGWATSPLKPGDVFTIAGVNQLNPPNRSPSPIEFRVIHSYEFALPSLGPSGPPDGRNRSR